VSKNPPVRPGLIIKQALEQGPHGISEMHRIYKDEVASINALRGKATRIRSATYWSFSRQCQFARALGLIEVDREEPFRPFPGREDNPLLSIRDGEVVTSTRMIYRLTPAGRAEETAWYNLGGAARDRLGWG